MQTSGKALQNPSILQGLLDFEKNNSRREEIKTLDVLSHRLLHFMMLEINQIGDALRLESDIKEIVWELMKHIFLKVKYVFVNRFVDQLILCSFYGICKIKGLNFQFKQIITKFVAKSYFPKKVKQRIIHECFLKADVYYSDGILYTKNNHKSK